MGACVSTINIINKKKKKKKTEGYAFVRDRYRRGRDCAGGDDASMPVEAVCVPIINNKTRSNNDGDYDDDCGGDGSGATGSGTVLTTHATTKKHRLVPNEDKAKDGKSKYGDDDPAECPSFIAGRRHGGGNSGSRSLARPTTTTTTNNNNGDDSLVSISVSSHGGVATATNEIGRAHV